MYISEDLQQELDFFKRTNEHFEIKRGLLPKNSIRNMTQKCGRNTRL